MLPGAEERLYSPPVAQHRKRKQQGFAQGVTQGIAQGLVRWPGRRRKPLWSLAAMPGWHERAQLAL